MTDNTYIVGFMLPPLNYDALVVEPVLENKSHVGFWFTKNDPSKNIKEVEANAQPNFGASKIFCLENEQIYKENHICIWLNEENRLIQAKMSLAN